MPKVCKHYWHYPPAIYEGRTDEEAAITRFCIECNKQQIGYVTAWKRVPRAYADMKDELRAEGER